jgi:dephospho-CoA kinase
MSSAIRSEWPQLRLIGLTGNIATGKSTVVSRLRVLGAATIDADQVARQVVEAGKPALAQIVREFGARVLHEDGTLNRKALGAIVFNDAARLRALEAITHPAIRVAMQAQLRAINDVGERHVVALEVIRLFESGWAAVCDQIWVTHCPESMQIERLIRARKLSPSEARARVRAQQPQAEKLASADVVIDTAGSIDDTQRQVDAAWQRFVGTSSGL